MSDSLYTQRFVMSEEASIDIDTLEDFQRAWELKARSKVSWFFGLSSDDHSLKDCQNPMAYANSFSLF